MSRKNPHAVALGRIGGSVTSDAKSAAAKANGAKGGRPASADKVAQRERERVRLRSHAALNGAVKRGEVSRPDRCQECGKRPDRFGRMEAHHSDHALPLDVEWLCSKCHGKRNFEAHLRCLFTVGEWSVLAAKAKREGVSLRALILGWCKEWIEKD